MALLATHDDLAARLQVDVSSLNLDAADRVLRDADGMVRAIGRQQFEFIPQETVTLPGGGQILTLPERPLVVDGANPLTVVELGDFGDLDFTAVEGRDYVRLGNELTRGHPLWWTTRLMGWPFNRPLGVWAPRVRVTYSHGDATIPGDVISVVLDVAQMMYANPAGLRSFTTPEYSETYATEVLGRNTVQGIKAALSATGRRRGSFSI